MRAKVAIRSFFKAKTHSSITLASLSIGLAVNLILIQYINNQINFDSFFTDSENIYRIDRTINEDKEEVYNSMYTFPALSLELLSNYPDIENATRVLTRSGIVAYGTKSFREDEMIHADEKFVEIFKLQFIEGSPYNCLNDPNTIIISESFKNKYFTGEALGKSINVGGEETYKITGVYLDIPPNTHFKFTAVLSYSTYKEYDRIMTSWNWNMVRTYIKLNPNVAPLEFEAKLSGIEGKMLSLSNVSKNIKLNLVPLTSIHYREYDFSSISVLWGLGVIAIVIMSVGWLNYLNLLLSKVNQNKRRVAIKKALGASQFNFIVEQFAIATIYLLSSILVGGVLVGFALPLFNAEFNCNISFFKQSTRNLSLSIIGVYVIVNIIISMVPLKVIKSTKSSIQNVLKNRRRTYFLVMPNTLLVFQFIIVALTIGSVLAIDNQVTYMIHADKNFDSKNILIIEPPDIFDDEYNQGIKLFKNTCAEFHNVKNVSVSSSVPGQKIEDSFVNEIHVSGLDTPEETIYVNWCDEDYLSTYGFNLLEGNSMTSASIEKNAIINQSAITLLNQDPANIIGKYIVTPYDSARIVGIIQDFNQSSLKDEYKPQVIISDPEAWGYISLAFSNGISKNDIDMVKQAWNKSFSNSPFEFIVEDDFFNNQYSQEVGFIKLFYFVSYLSIFISIIGLLGFTIGQIEINKKPFVIRRVFGSSRRNIILLISKNYLKNVIYTYLIVIPFIIYFNNEWLKTYSFHDTVKANVLFAPIVVLVVICSLSIAYHFIITTKTSLPKLLHED